MVVVGNTLAGGKKMVKVVCERCTKYDANYLQSSVVNSK